MVVASYRALSGGSDIFAEGPLAWLPEQCLDEEVAECMREEHRKKPGNTAPLMCVCGPAVLWMHAASAITWTFFLLYPLYAFHFCHCYGNDMVYAQNSTPAMWLPFAPVLAVTLSIEEKCLSYIIGIYVQVRKGNITLLCSNFKDWDFKVWRYWMLAQSIVSHMSIVSNGLLLVRCWTTEYGGCNQKLVETWKYVIMHSAFRSVLPYHIATWAVALWCLMLLQPVVGLLRTLPIGPPVSMHDREGDPGVLPGSTISLLCQRIFGCGAKDFNVDYTIEVSRSKAYEYRTPLNLRQNHASAAYVLGCATRMSAITSPNFGYEMARIDMHEHGGVASKFDAERILNHLYDAIFNKLSDFWLVGILENLFSLHLQISLLALNRAVRENGKAIQEGDLQTLFSIVLNMGSLALRTTSVSDIVYIRRIFWRKVEEMRAKDGFSEFVAIRISSMQKFFWCFDITMAIYVALLFLAAVKLGALFACGSGLFNLLEGCVE